MIHASLNIIGFHQTDVMGQKIQNLVGQSGLNLQLTDLKSVFRDFEKSVGQNRPDIMVIEYSNGGTFSKDMIDRLRRANPDSEILALSDCRDPDEILKAMRMGIKEFLLEPVDVETFTGAITRMRPHQKLKGEPGLVISIMSAKGGMGASQLAVNLGWALNTERKREVVLVDMNLQGGDLANLLDVKPVQNLGHVAQHPDRFSFMSDGFMTNIRDGLKLLASPENILTGSEINSHQIAGIIETLADNNSIVLIDQPSRQLTEATITALDQSKYIFVVTDASMPGLASVLQLTRLMEKLDYGPEKVRVILNRAGSRLDLSYKKAQKALGVPFYGLIPNDSTVVYKSVKAGRPVREVAKRSRFWKHVSKLAARIDLENQNYKSEIGIQIQ